MANKRDADARRRARKARARRERRQAKSADTLKDQAAREEAPGAKEAARHAKPEAKPEAKKAEAARKPNRKERRAAKKAAKKAGREPMSSGSKRNLRVGCAVAGALVVGALLGYVNAPDVRTTGLGTTTISENDTGHELATWTQGRDTHSVTMGDYAQWSSTQAANGVYSVPSASSVVSYIQWQVELQAANQQNIEVSDDDLEAYAKDQLGADSIDSLAQSANMSTDQVKSVLNDTVRISKLRDQVAGTVTVQQPTSPTAPSDGSDDATNADYAKYITDMAGDEWDSSANDGKGGWKDSTSALATALADFDVSNDSASYKAAQAAYQERSQEYSTQQQNVTKAWNDYVDGILKDVTIQLRDSLVGSD